MTTVEMEQTALNDHTMRLSFLIAVFVEKGCHLPILGTAISYIEQLGAVVFNAVGEYGSIALTCRKAITVAMSLYSMMVRGTHRLTGM